MTGAERGLIWLSSIFTFIALLAVLKFFVDLEYRLAVLETNQKTIIQKLKDMPKKKASNEKKKVYAPTWAEQLSRAGKGVFTRSSLARKIGSRANDFIDLADSLNMVNRFGRTYRLNGQFWSYLSQFDKRN